MKKLNAIVFLLIILIITGCTSKNEDGIDMNMYKTKNFSHTTCTKNAKTDDNKTKVDIKYDIYYNSKNYIEVLISKEQVSTTNNETLDKYETAYNNVFKVYKDLEYYDNVVLREKDKVTSKTYINYGKINIDKLMEIEGEEDNVKVTNGKIKLNDWKNFAKKYGTTCRSVS